MKRTLFLTAVFMLAVAGASFGFGNANGIGYYALEIPTDVTITIDGNSDDWAWFDNSFTYGPDDMIEIITGEMPPKSDIDMAVMTAWTGSDRDNKLYGLVRVTDDTLNVAATEGDNGWLDDDLEICIDADHSGGPFRAEGVVTGVNASQFTMHMSTPGGYDTGYGNGTWWMRYQAPAEIHWIDALADAQIGAVPSGATTGFANVVITYEFSVPLFDEVLLAGEAASPRHIMTAGEIIGLTYQLNDADIEARSAQLSTAAENGAAWDATFSSEYTLLAIDEYDRGTGGTAVNSSSWGMIKATF
jgi:cellulose/xylan binding protein with CBM9 domain